MIISNFKSILSLIVLISASMLIFSCGEDDTPIEESTNEMLNGVWSVSSFTEQGTELLGNEFGAYELRFVMEGENGGAFSGVSTDPSTTLAASYELVDEGTRIKIGPDTLSFNLNLESLTMSGENYFIQNDVSITATKQ